MLKFDIDAKNYSCRLWRSALLLLMIDNYDSFTYNIVQYFEQLGQDVVVWQNDSHPVDAVSALNPDYIVIGPGPKTPSDAGISLQVIQQYAGIIPILGVCLGHQAIGQAFGGNVVRADEVMHGRVSAIYHDDSGIFCGLPSPFKATRYHSLVVDAASLPSELLVNAWAIQADGSRAVMGIRHRELALEGVQFHPESILSEHGHLLLQNFLNNYK
jgi:anthranilate synthase/aminodeoxychorismate synthase-like glutamine amidotransferase